MSKFGCGVAGCDAHPSRGDTIIRVSPKGEPFRGRCTSCFEGAPDPVVVRIVRALGGVRD